MGKSAGDAPSPDPKIGEAALQQAKTGEQWLSFAKDAFKVSTSRQAELDKLTKTLTDKQLGIITEQERISKEDRARYETKFRPLEDQFVKEASEYGSEANQDKAAAEAVADVRKADQVADGTRAREMASMGITPGSGRFAGIEREADLNTSLASAGAANNARQARRDKGLALKADAVNLGRGLPAQSAAATQLGLGAGNSAFSNNYNSNGQYIASTGMVGQGYQGAMSGYGGMANTLQGQDNFRLNAWQTENQIAASNASGIGQFLGGAIGLFASDENVKHDKEAIPDGEALEALNEMPVEEWTYDEGVADGGRHVGTYAQDFKRATGKGDGRAIPAQDAIGITMKAVQDLDKKLDRVVSAIGLGRGGVAMGAA